MSEKPPYRIPSMEELRAVPWNGYNVVSTFTGAGGSCLGFRWAGFRTVYASEFVPAARETFAANQGWEPDPRDVREVTSASVRALAEVRGLGKGQEIDVLEGSPPCASFSMSGSRAKHWGEVRKYSDVRQRTDDLFTEFARLVGELRPKVFVAENVSGLLRGVARGYFKEIHAQLAAQGYVVRAKLLDAQWLGVPQARRRVILIGVREDLGLEPAFPTPLPYRYSIRDALPHLGGVIKDTMAYEGRTAFGLETEPIGTIRVSGGSASRYRVRPAAINYRGGARLKRAPVALDKPSPAIAAQGAQMQEYEITDAQIVTRPWSGSPRMRVDLDEPLPTVLAAAGGGDGKQAQRFAVLETDPETGYRITMEGHALAPFYRRLQPGESSDRYFNLVRPDEREPVPTIVAENNRRGVAGVAHPTQARKFTLEELRRLCGFPDDFVLTGTYSQRWERLGRAVPPPMARAIADSVRQVLDQAKGKVGR